MTRRNPLLDDPDSDSPRVHPPCTAADAETPEVRAVPAAAFVSPEPGPDDLALLAIGPDLRDALIDAGVMTVGELRRTFETLTYRELREQLDVSDTGWGALCDAMVDRALAVPAPQADPAPAVSPAGPTAFEALMRAEVARQAEFRRARGRGGKPT